MDVNIDEVFASALDLSDQIQNCYNTDLKGKNNKEISEKLKVRINEFCIARIALFNQFDHLLKFCPPDQLNGLDSELVQINERVEELQGIQKRIEETVAFASTLHKRKGSSLEDARGPKRIEYDLCQESTHVFPEEDIFDLCHLAKDDTSTQTEETSLTEMPVDKVSSNETEEKSLTEMANEANETARILGGDFFEYVPEDVSQATYIEEYAVKSSHVSHNEVLSQTQSKEKLFEAIERNDRWELRKLLPRLAPNVRESFYREINKLLPLNDKEPMASWLTELFDREKATITDYIAQEICISAAMDIELNEEIEKASQPQQPTSSSGVKNAAQTEQPLWIKNIEKVSQPQQPTSSSGVRNAVQTEQPLWIKEIENSQPQQPTSSSGVRNVAQAEQPLWIKEIENSQPQQPTSSSGVRNVAQAEQPLWIKDTEDAAQKEQIESPLKVRQQDKANLLTVLQINDREEVRELFLQLCPEIRNYFYNEINRLLYRQEKPELPDFFIAMCNRGDAVITENLRQDMCIQAANAISVLGKNTLYNHDE